MSSSGVAVLSCGNELLLGRILDTNVHWIAHQLTQSGVRVRDFCTVGDHLQELTAAIIRLCREHQVLIITGGLGPTPDDLTREALATASKTPLVLDPALLEEVEARFRQINRPMSETNRLQALLPRGANGIPNLLGTAPGVSMKIHGCRVFALPGVPSEMKAMMTASVLPALRSEPDRFTGFFEIHLWGIGESRVSEILSDLMIQGRNPIVGTMVHEMLITLRILCTATSPAESARLLEADRATIRQRLSRYIYGEGTTSISQAVIAALDTASATLSVAESCTGGLIGKLVTDTSGASRVFHEGFITYSDESKCRLLGVPADMIREFGAVSAEVATEMAKGVCRATGSTYGIGITGIAGPDGGSQVKPVGLVHVAISGPPGLLHQEYRLAMDREGNRARAAHMALGLLLRMIRFGIDPIP